MFWWILDGFLDGDWKMIVILVVLFAALAVLMAV
jgi:hypothetical protein